MARLIYAANMSLDGYTEDSQGGFNWAPPDDGVFASITDVMGSAGTYLYGRRMYEILAPWETDPNLAAGSELRASYAHVWKGADKIVFSSTLSAPITANTRLEREFDPGSIEQLKRTAGHDLLIGGPTLAAEAFAAGLVDDVVLYVWPIILGGRNPALPTGVHVDLELVDQQRFPSGALRLHYRVR